MMDPWTGIVKEDQAHSVHVEHVAAYFNQKVQENQMREDLKAIKNTRRTVFMVKERNYETYNYVAAKNREEEEEDPINDLNDDDTLSSILVRAMHRKNRRREIEEIRKMKAYEEEKKKIEEEKRQCQVAKRKHSEKLREMKENHQLRVMREQQWRVREARDARQMKLADEFRKRRLLWRYFHVFKELLVIKRENRIKARNHYRYKIVQRAFTKLVLNKDQEIRWRESMATNFHYVCILNKSFDSWKQEVQERRLLMEKSVQHHSTILLGRYLRAWKSWAVDELLHRRTQIQYADEHYRRNLLRKGLKHWKSFMEYKKKKRTENLLGNRLRTKVKDLLPDFSPFSTDDDEDDDEDDARREDERWEAILSVMTI